MKVSEDRKYVLVSKKWSKSSLMFWGQITDDSQERSFGGYTENLDFCERYTLDEIQNEGSYIPNLSAFSRADFNNKRKNKEAVYYATIEELEKALGKSVRAIIL